MNLIQKLIEVRKSCPYLKKENNGEQYKYVSSSQTLASLKSKMDELGLLLVPRIVGKNVRESTVEFKDKYDKPKRQTTYFTELDMEYTWINADDPSDTLASTWYGQGVDIAGEKGVGKALTYAEKYFMLKFFNIPTDKDDPDAFHKKHGEEDDQKSQLSGGQSGIQHHPPTQQQTRNGQQAKFAPPTHGQVDPSTAAYDIIMNWIEKVAGSVDSGKKLSDWFLNDANEKLAAQKSNLNAKDLSAINRHFEATRAMLDQKGTPQ